MLSVTVIESVSEALTIFGTRPMQVQMTETDSNVSAVMRPDY